MKVSPEELKRRTELFKTGIKKAGIKLTHQRLEIFNEIAKSTEHPDAEKVFKGVRKRVPTVSLDTVYRTLWLLLDFGLISTIGSPRERARFDANTKSHHHFVCTRCGMTVDFYSDSFDNLAIPNEVSKMGDVEKTHVEIRGICKKCAAKSDGT